MEEHCSYQACYACAELKPKCTCTFYQIYSVYMSKFASFLSQILLLCSPCDSSSCPFPPARRPVSETGGERGWAEGGGGGGYLCHPGRHKVWSQIREAGLIVYIRNNDNCARMIIHGYHNNIIIRFYCKFFIAVIME